ncbi:MAG: glycosyltransferase [Oligoflexia bacterium]|nr:glycosyltransferase [Oligoflexia bacterium]
MKTCSIITVTYKDPSGLQRTYDSLRVLKENSSIEWVVVDSSPELNKQVLELAMGEGFLVKHITSKPEGIYAAMNIGVQASIFEYLWFLNGGDELNDLRGLEELLSENTEENDLLIGAVELSDLDSSKKKIIPPPRKLFSRLLGINRICHQSILYNKELFKVCDGFYDLRYRIVADYLHLLKNKKNIKNIYVTNKVVANFYKGGASQDIIPALKEFFLVHYRNEAKSSSGERVLHLAFWLFFSIGVVLRRSVKVSLGILGIKI